MRSHLGALLLLGAGLATAQPAGFAAMPFAVDSRQELLGALNVALDTDGNAQLFWRGRLLLQVELLASDAEGWQRPEGESQLLRRHWPYFHLDGVEFWQRRQADASLATGFRVRSAQALQVVDWEIRAHGSVGSAYAHRLRFARLELPGGYELAIFDPAGHSLQNSGDDVWLFDAAQASSWMFAVALAEDSEILAYDIGQALMSMRDRVHLGEIEPPPLCERCRTPGVDSLGLQLAREDEEWVLSVSMDPAQLELPHERPLFATLALGSVRMREFLSEAGPSSAVYRVPASAIDAGELQRELSFSSPQLRLLSQAGEAFAIGEIQVELPTPSDAAANARSRVEFPKLLSPTLLDASPNPFQESTWLRVTIPTTIEQAFELDDELRAKVDPLAAPPFGDTPRVRVRVYNVKGKLVRTLYEGIGDSAEIALSWNGQDDAGQLVASGAYYLNLQIEEYAVTRRVTVLRP